MTGCSLPEGQTKCFRQGRQKQPMILMGGKLWTCVVASVSAPLLHLSIPSWIFKGNLLINWWSKTCSTPPFKCHTPKITLFWDVWLSGRRQSGMRDEADHLVAVLVFVPALQHLQPLAGSLHLCVFLLLGEKKTTKVTRETFSHDAFMSDGKSEWKGLKSYFYFIVLKSSSCSRLRILTRVEN